MPDPNVTAQQAPPLADPAETILRSASGVDDATKANAWDAFHGSTSEDDLANKLQNMNLPQEVKAGLWDAKHSLSSQPPTPSAPLTEAAAASGNFANQQASQTQTARDLAQPTHVLVNGKI